MGDLTDSQATPSPTPTPETSTAARNPRTMPVREDCWSEDATFTLIEAWGKHFVDLNRGNLRQKHWQEVSDAVNAFHAEFNDKVRRSDVQCKNRIDTLKKKYKIEKARVLESRGSYQSTWPFFAPLDSLIGSTPSALKRPSPSAVSHSSLFLPAASVAMPAHQAAGARTGPPMAVPLLPHRRTPPPAGLATVVPQKRSSPAFTAVAATYPDIRKNYSSMAAAAAAAMSDDEEIEEEEEEEDLDDSIPNRERGEAEGMRKLAGAIERFAEVYERVEADKQRQIVELEKQRMQFAKELECQRMQMLVEMQVQLEKVKKLKR